MILPPARFFAQPPTQAELDFTNPILKNIEHVISGNAAFLTKGNYNTSLRTGTIAPALIRRPSGLSYALGTGAAGVNWVATDAGPWVNSQGEWTFFTLSFWRGGSANRSISTIAESPGSTTRDRSMSASFSAGGFFQVSTRDGATDVSVLSTTTLTSIGINPFTLAGRAKTSELAIFVNGTKEASTAITSTGRTYTSPELVLGQGGIGTGIANGQQGNSDPSIFLAWSRALSDEEIASLHRNPWQVFRSASRIIAPESAAVTAYTLDTTPGAYNITGSSATTIYGRQVDTTPASYTITGASVTALYDSQLDISPATYNLSGSTTETLYNRQVDVSHGSYNVTGSNVTVLADWLINASPGSYNVNGSSVTLTRVGLAWPDPGDVRFGVEYGPTGTEYVGTMRAGTVWLRRR